MSLEWFLKLREYDSLSKMRINHLKAINEQDDRLSTLLDRKNSEYVQTEKLKQEHISLKQSLHETDQKIRLAEVQGQRLKDIGGDDKKIADFQRHMEEAEELGLTLLSKLEEIEQELSDKQLFLKGLEKTLQEIQLEADEIKSKELSAIEQLNLRLRSLEDELPSEFRDTLKKVESKKLAQGSFTRVENGSCFFCRYKISRIDESEIDSQQKLKLCPQCGRIFLPYGA